LPLDEKLYRATIDEADPTRFLDVGILANEISPEEHAKLDFVPWASSLTVLRLELESSGPHDGRKRRLFWLTDEAGRMGPVLALPPSSRFGCCACVENEDRVELFRVQLDGGIADDLLVKTTHKQMTLGGPINGEPHCPVLVNKVEYFAYRLDTARLQFARASTPTQARVAELLRRAERLD
jgi:hypothetical protein